MSENSQKIYRDIEMKGLNGCITEENCQFISIYYTHQSNNITFRTQNSVTKSQIVTWKLAWLQKLAIITYYKNVS